MPSFFALQSWNFLTRTNCQYEFISVRLTIFWVVGFMLRYFLLLPLRILILVIGVSRQVWFISLGICILNHLMLIVTNIVGICVIVIM